MEGAGEKAFCAGGDIRGRSRVRDCVCVCVIYCTVMHLNTRPIAAVTEAGKAGHSLAQTFFLREYTLNHLIGELP